ncbi:MAG: hypothetical protein IKT46_08925 [Clostridia bacterium]|nr:hypothetical protein [Clostridia bacterium]
MKKYIFIILVIILTICVTIATVILCDKDGSVDDISVKTKESTDGEEIQSQDIDFTAEYIRTGSYIEGNVYPIVETICSYEALTEYYESNKESYYLERRDKSYEDSTLGFLDAYDSYTEDFFEDKSLIFVILEEPSGSIRHKVDYVRRADGGINIGIDPIVPEACTDDMALWHIIISVDKIELPKNEKSIRIFYDSKEMPREYFAFSFTWGCYGVSFYDSETGILIKEKNATYPHKYTTNLTLTKEQLNEISTLIEELDINSYYDRYDPHNGKLHSSPSMTLVLSVKTEDYYKSVTAEDIALGFDECSNQKGRKFLSVCKRIQQIITESEEWKALPEYEFIYS